MSKVAFVLANDFEDSEFKVPYDRVREAGHQATVIGAKAGEEVKGKKGKESATIETTAGQVDAAGFDALVIPGGYSPDHLRLDKDVVALVRRFVESGKPVAAICHGPQLLIEADAVKGRTMTSWPSVRKDIENAGGRWVDREVVIDGNLITSRKPDDLGAFSRALLEHLPSQSAR
jgi:protease I